MSFNSLNETLISLVVYNFCCSKEILYLMRFFFYYKLIILIRVREQRDLILMGQPFGLDYNEYKR